MQMIPSLFQETLELLDDGFGGAWFNNSSFDNIEKKLFSRKARNRMCTDIRETDTDYEMIVDLPGYRKDDVSIKLENGYITISASKCMGEGKDERETNEKTGMKADTYPFYKSDSKDVSGAYSKNAYEAGLIVNSKNDVTRDKTPSTDAPKNMATDMSKKDDKSCKYICRERYCGECSRTFYVGDEITEGDIKAKFEHGLLTLHFPKKNQKQVETCKYISIEG